VRPLIIGVLTLCIFLLSACASVPDRPFTLIKPQEGWVQLKAPPEESGAIIEAAGGSTKQMLSDRKYQATWFARKTDDYLIYFQVRAADADCGDEAPEFYKDEDGRWIEDRLSRISLCKH
jgi:hypothetical protein